MIISAACSPSSTPPKRSRRVKRWQRTARTSALLLILSLVLVGCIQPATPIASVPGGVPTLATAIPPIAGATTAPPIAQQPTVNPANAGISAYPPAADRVWQQAAVGPEQVAVLFLHDAANNPCVRYIFRAKVVARCGVPGQTLIAVAGVEAAADGKSYTIIAGRALDTRIVAVSVEFTPNGNQPAQINSEGFIIILVGSRLPLDAIPINEHGDQVGAKFKF